MISRNSHEFPQAQAVREAGAGASAPASDLRLRWWRGEDLNLRPSGYEPANGVVPYSPLVPSSSADEAIAQRS